MRIRFTPLLLLILFISCKSSKNDQVRFAFNEYFILSDNEKEFPLNDVIVNEYESYNGMEEINIPLNRYISSPEYKIYIAVAIENTLQQTVDLYLSDLATNVLESKNEKAISLFCKKSDLFAIKYLYEEKHQKLPVIINVVSKDSIKIKKLYDENYIFKKIK